jgi:phage shock protein PspC (stress-responsive transcriptional regulator)
MATAGDGAHDAAMTTAGTPNAGTTTPPPATEPYKLLRPRKGRMIVGVAAGIATATGLDVTLVRICIGASMLSGLGVIGYILLWLVVPEEQPSRGRYAQPAPEPTARTIRIALVGVAALGVLKQVGIFWPFQNDHTHFGLDTLLALVLLSLGVGVLVSRHRSDAWAPSVPPPDAPPPPSEPFTPWTAPVPTPPADDDATAGEDAAAAADPDAVTFVGPLRGVAETVHRDVSRSVSGARTEHGDNKSGGAALGWARVAGWLVLLWWVAGLLVLLGLWRFGAVEILAPGLLFVSAWAVFTLVLNFLLRVRNAPLVLLSLATLLIPVLLALATVRADGPAGSRTLRPIAMPERATYRQSVGKLELDLSDARLSTERANFVDARIGTGGLIVTVPDNASVTVITRVDAGGYDVLGKRNEGGIGQRETLRFDGCEGAPHVQLRLRGGAGWIEVNRPSGDDPVCASAA